MNNVKGYAIATDGAMKRIAVTYDVIDETTGKVINSNVKINRVVTNEKALAAIEILDTYVQETISTE